MIKRWQYSTFNIRVTSFNPSEISPFLSKKRPSPNIEKMPTELDPLTGSVKKRQLRFNIEYLRAVGLAAASKFILSKIFRMRVF